MWISTNTGASSDNKAHRRTLFCALALALHGAIRVVPLSVIFDRRQEVATRSKRCVDVVLFVICAFVFSWPALLSCPCPCPCPSRASVVPWFRFSSASLRDKVTEPMLIESLTRELRDGVRALARTPFLTAVVLLSLGIGIGANTIVFSWVQAVVFRPLPGVERAWEFLLVETRAEAGSQPGSSWREYRRSSSSASTRSPTCSPSAWCRSISARQAAPSAPTRCSCPITISPACNCSRRGAGSFAPTKSSVPALSQSSWSRTISGKHDWRAHPT